MALNNDFKVKNNLDTLGKILSSGRDIAEIFAASNTSWTLSATNANFNVAGGETLKIQGNNGVDVKANASTDTLTVSGINATTSTKGVASFNSASFDVTNGAVSVKTGGISNAQLSGFIDDSKLNNITTAGKVANSATTATSANDPNTIVLRNANGNFNAGTITAVTLSTQGGTSTQWNSTYTTVQANSATIWNYQGTDLKALSANWQGTYTNVQSNSANWNTAYNTATTYQQVSGGFALSGYNTTIDNAVSSVTVGGASPLPASEWKQKSIVQVLDTILFPDLDPTYTLPTLTIAFNSGATNGGIYEVGTVISPVLTATGIKNDAGNFTSITFQRDSTGSLSTVTNPTSTAQTNVADLYGQPNPNNPNARYVPGYTDSSFTLPTPTTTTWRVIANINAGLPKNNNKGVLDTRTAGTTVNTPQAARTSFASSTVSAISRYRRWVGSVVAPLGSGADYRTAGLTSDLLTGNDFITNSNPVYIDKETIVVLIPTGKTLRKVTTASFEVIYDSTDPLTTASWTLSSNAQIPDAGNTNRTYNLYYKINATPLNANLIEVTLQ
jgi:hypothetical protein